jgi:hypothetical protein
VKERGFATAPVISKTGSSSGGVDVALQRAGEGMGEEEMDDFVGEGEDGGLAHPIR